RGSEEEEKQRKLREAAYNAVFFFNMRSNNGRGHPEKKKRSAEGEIQISTNDGVEIDLNIIADPDTPLSGATESMMGMQEVPQVHIKEEQMRPNFFFSFIIARKGQRQKLREPFSGEKRSLEVEKWVRKEPIEIGVELGLHLRNTIKENMYDCETSMAAEIGQNGSPRSP
ncbi:hypothetical protein GBA52_007694, partial [Prunus armeniaca]